MPEADDACIHFIWPPSMCSICNGRVAREHNRSVVPRGKPFEARYPGKCAACRLLFDAGDLIVRVDTGYAHTACSET